MKIKIELEIIPKDNIPLFEDVQWQLRDYLDVKRFSYHDSSLAAPVEFVTHVETIIENNPNN